MARAGGLLLRTALGAVLADLPLESGKATVIRHLRLGVGLPVVRAAPVAVRCVVPLWRPKGGVQGRESEEAERGHRVGGHASCKG